MIRAVATSWPTVLGLFFSRRLKLGHDLKDPVAAFLGLVELKVELGSVFDVEGLVDFRLPLLLQRVQVVQDLLVGCATVEMGNKYGGVTEIWTDIHPGDGEEHSFQGALPANEAGENAPN